MGEILNLIKHRGDPTVCNTVSVLKRTAWYEAKPYYCNAENLECPRIITSHVPLHIFTKTAFQSKAKVIYTMRNPKDIFVSLIYFNRMLKFYKEEAKFQDFLEDFLHGNVLYGSWFDHVKGWMQMAGNENFFYITYEELKQDLRGSVMRICKFLGKELNDEEIDSVVKHSSFNAMKENKMCNGSHFPEELLDNTKGSLMRKGICGDWKNHFTVAQSEYFDKVYQEKMKDLNVTFPWEEIDDTCLCDKKHIPFTYVKTKCPGIQTKGYLETKPFPNA
ncbi:hypothetical protein GDO86_012425 [Hymenochirus boettgeri]|uniref:Sulfotransferase n=1 Tax=Hymenochirus boettgeri TaxID=247094 RepID=A0A8T2ISI3_9PIPI|nr:hypothetical protein GDO86_012425 [Hymenochirus boettgeri]